MDTVEVLRSPLVRSQLGLSSLGERETGSNPSAGAAGTTNSDPIDATISSLFGLEGMNISRVASSSATSNPANTASAASIATSSSGNVRARAASAGGSEHHVDIHIAILSPPTRYVQQILFQLLQS